MIITDEKDKITFLETPVETKDIYLGQMYTNEMKQTFWYYLCFNT